MRHSVLSAVVALTALHSVPAPVQAQSLLASGNIWINGNTEQSVWAGDPYSFTPAVFTRSGAMPTRFGIINMPSWARMAANGTLSGTPGPQHVGLHHGIYLIAYVGAEYAMFGPFSILVRDTSTSPRVTLSWQRPSQNADGSPLDDLGGYRVLAARQGQVLKEVQRIHDSTATRTVVDRLDAGTWYFQVTALTESGVESVPSRMVWKNVR